MGRPIPSPGKRNPRPWFYFEAAGQNERGIPEKETAAGKGQEAGEPLALGAAFGLLLGLLLENLLLGFVLGTAVGAAAGMVRKKR